jgi:hypothetical protein
LSFTVAEIKKKHQGDFYQTLPVASGLPKIPKAHLAASEWG